MELHALTLATRSYALLIVVLCHKAMVSLLLSVAYFCSTTAVVGESDIHVHRADVFHTFWMLLSNQIFKLESGMGGGDNGVWMWVARGNIQQISYIPRTKQHLFFGLTLLQLGECNYICT